MPKMRIANNPSEGYYQLICFKFAGWEPFHVHVRFQFAVVLLTFSVGVVGIHDRFICPAKVRPPCIHLDIRNKKNLSFFCRWCARSLHIPPAGKWFSSLLRRSCRKCPSMRHRHIPSFLREGDGCPYSNP